MKCLAKQKVARNKIANVNAGRLIESNKAITNLADVCGVGFSSVDNRGSNNSGLGISRFIAMGYYSVRFFPLMNSPMLLRVRLNGVDGCLTCDRQ